jgi:retron-type reverse transcriptase
MQEGIGWIVDADVSGYFDSIDRTRLREVLRQRVNDGRVLRLIGKWLRAGVMEEGLLTHPETGVVQGGGISPILANIFLHEVLDEPRKAWRLLQGASPCRVRASPPPVASLASMAEPWRHGEQDGRSVDSESWRP